MSRASLDDRHYPPTRFARFVLDPAKCDGCELCVRTCPGQLLTMDGEKPVNLIYRLREVGGTWKIIDVIYEFVSQLATRRSEFASTVAAGGAPALVKKLDELSDKLMAGKGRSASQ